MWGSCLKLWGLGFRVEGSDFRVWGLGSRVGGGGFRVPTCAVLGEAGGSMDVQVLTIGRDLVDD